MNFQLTKDNSPLTSGSDISASRYRLLRELRRMGITDERVLAAIGKLPRHQFVDEGWQADVYQNKSLPIGYAQTISQPYMVALMSQLALEGAMRRKVLEVGTGTGYQSAVLAELVEAVFSVERVRPLAVQARQRLRHLGYRNIHCGYADGCNGWRAHAPYDAIIVTAAAPEIPRSLIDQLARGGRLVIPVGPEGTQTLKIVDRTACGPEMQEIAPVSFVPLLTGRV